MRTVTSYELLANAIVLQAVDDYRRLWNYDKDDYAKRELVNFFYSEWFATLTTLNPVYLVERLEEEADAKREKVYGSY